MSPLAILASAAFGQLSFAGGPPSQTRLAAEAQYRALPQALRVPLELDWVDRPSPCGMGTDDAGERAGERFQVYRAAPCDERGSFRLEALDRPAQERLWARRAVVHAAIEAADAKWGLSRDPRWRHVNGWLDPLSRPFTWSERSLNLSPDGYSRARGRASAAEDLATFAEEWLAPVESESPGALPPDDSVRCQEPTKARALAALLEAHGAAGLPTRGDCPALDHWVDAGELDHLEVLLVQSSGQRPESLFGHLLLRPVFRGDGHLGPSFRSVIQLGALTDPGQGLKHLARGIFGGYRMLVLTLSEADLEREMLSSEQRTMRRFRLALTPAEADAVMERAWELERHGLFDYQFFTDNCAAGLLWVLQGALFDAQLEPEGRLFVSPSAVLDQLAATQVERAGARRPLLELESPALLSSGEEAARSESIRSRLEAELDDRALAAALVSAHDPSPATRRAAYESAAELTPRASAADRRRLFEWWAHAARVERASADLAAERLHQLDLRRVDPAALAPVDLDRELAERARLFRRESLLERQRMMLDRAELARERLGTLARRPLTAEEARAKREDEAFVALFDRVTELEGALAQTAFGSERPRAFLDADLAARAAEETTRAEQSVPRSGHWQAQLGAGVGFDARGAASPVLTFQSAGLAELLGDQRQRGFESGVAMRLLDGSLVVDANGGLPSVRSSQFTVFGFDTFVHPPPVLRRSWTDAIGFGFEVANDYRRDRAWPGRTGVVGRLNCSLLDRDRHQAVVAVELGAALQAGWGDRFTPLGALQGGVVLRAPLPGRWPAALRARVRYQLAEAVLGWQTLHEVGAELGVDLFVGDAPLLVRPEAWVATQLGTGWLEGGVAVSLQLR